MGNSFYNNKEQPEKIIKIETYPTIFDVIANIPEILQFKEKNSNDFIKLVARHCNFVGMTKEAATDFMRWKYGLDELLASPIVSQIYKEYAGENGTKALMYNLKVRNKFEDEDWKKMPYIPNVVYKNIPNIFQQAVEKIQDRRERDVFLTALLGITSGMLNIYGVYRGKKTYPNLYCFIVAPAASGKGIVIYAKTIGKAREMQIHERNNNIFLFIPANISTASLYEHLSKNDGIGILFESEADTMKNTFKQEWGGYDDLLRKAFHFEEISMRRKGKDKKDIFIRIEHPRLSVILSGTKNQIQGIIPDAENGLFSRFIFYTFKSDIIWDREPDIAGISLDDFFLELSGKLATIIDKAESIQQFSFTDEQKTIFHDRFEKWQSEFVLFYNEESIGIIRRLADITFRIAMILTTIRYGEQENPTENTIVYCNETDFNTAFQLAETYKHHSLFVFVTLKNDSEKKKPIDKMVQMFFEKLPFEFTKSKAIEIGKTKEIEIADRTVTKYLNNLVNAGHLEQPKYGNYRKIQIKKVEDENQIEE